VIIGKVKLPRGNRKQGVLLFLEQLKNSGKLVMIHCPIAKQSATYFRCGLQKKRIAGL